MAAKPPRDEARLVRLGELGELQCPPTEVAAILGLTEIQTNKLLTGRTADRKAYEAGKARGLANLRGAQFKLAQSNASMAIILGKAYLGQVDRREAVESGAFDVEAARQRVRDKLAAILGAAETEGGRRGD